MNSKGQKEGVSPCILIFTLSTNLSQKLGCWSRLWPWFFVSVFFFKSILASFYPSFQLRLGSAELNFKRQKRPSCRICPLNDSLLPQLRAYTQKMQKKGCLGYRGFWEFLAVVAGQGSFGIFSLRSMGSRRSFRNAKAHGKTQLEKRFSRWGFQSALSF